MILFRIWGPVAAKTPAGLSLDMSLECPQAMTSNISGAQDNPHDPNSILEQRALLNFWSCRGRDWTRTIPALPHSEHWICVLRTSGTCCKARGVLTSLWHFDLPLRRHRAPPKKGLLSPADCMLYADPEGLLCNLVYLPRVLSDSIFSSLS